MQIPNIPTDNLYKFAALSGVVLALVAIVLPSIVLPPLISRVADLQGEAGLIELENSFLREDIERETGRPPDEVEVADL